MTRDFERRLRELERKVHSVEQVLTFDWDMTQVEPEDPTVYVFTWDDHFGVDDAE